MTNDESTSDNDSTLNATDAPEIFFDYVQRAPEDLSEHFGAGGALVTEARIQVTMSAAQSAMLDGLLAHLSEIGAPLSRNEYIRRAIFAQMARDSVVVRRQRHRRSETTTNEGDPGEDSDSDPRPAPLP